MAFFSEASETGSDFVVCSGCGAEFQPHVTHCIDCGAPTRPPGPADTEREGPAGLHPLPTGTEIVDLRTEDFEWIETLRERLKSNGVSCHIKEVDLPGTGRKPSRQRYALSVAKEDLALARQLDIDLLRERTGEEGADLGEDTPPGQCPMCGCHFPAGTLECPECGLSVGGDVVPEAEEEAGGPFR
jgi:rRNA maturation endonuclease Nob1